MARPLLCLALLCASLAFTTCAGIRLELIHVDSKENCTVEERMRRATERTHRRLASMGGVTAPIHWGGQSQYIAEYLIGNPPQRAEAVIDTGSNLIWTQCSACRPTCFKQSLPYYEPSRSRTDIAVDCNDAACALGSETQCLSDNKTCAVITSYGAGDIAGVLGTENFTFQSESARLVFGCILVTKLSPGTLNGASGIIGLGRGKLSLPSQLGDTRFSYCLTPYFSGTIESSHMIVGASAGLVNGSASTVTTIPFVKSPSDDPFNTFYYLPLTGITVGKAKLAVPSTAFDLQKVAPRMWTGTFIDSGAPLTSLVDVAYRALRAELARQLGASVVPPPAGTAGSMINLCVALKDADRLVPPLVLHFGGGADLVVPPANYWAPVDTATACMVVVSSVVQKSLPMNETSVIGNFMQQNMHAFYDLAGGVLSFQPADCSSI